MRRIAVTGHRGLPADVERTVDTALRGLLTPMGAGLVGLSCLADGADTLFARAVLAAGGAIEAVVPAAGYRDALPAAHRPVYDALLAAAARVHRLPHPASTSDAHLDAGRFLVEHCDELVAVWDGAPARGRGGTADIVADARRRGRPVAVVWPDGARR
ncbi:hypothetical protein [Nocardiopsis trehalosi]|uniref:hypothetical protein n=1 Tax=Nocardiopsis trehalosi TaxID=109329 RepID=UPI0008346B5B|nr:hypothetical protein [Nocardiopsis trehalosi]